MERTSCREAVRNFRIFGAIGTSRTRRGSIDPMHLTVREAATYFDVDEDTIVRWIAERDLPVHRVTERLHLNAIELWEWAVARGIPVSRQLLDEAQRKPDEIAPLWSLLESGGIHRDLEGRDKSALLANMVRRLDLPSEVDRDHLFAVLEAREAMGSTGIGDGIAIPHVRNPILLHVAEASLMLFLLSHPVDFDSIDGKPVQTVFLVVTPNVPTHLRVLSRLAFALRDAKLRSLLQGRAADERIIARVKELERR